jgi:tripartite ATP-independent transporter DctM subunit
MVWGTLVGSLFTLLAGGLWIGIALAVTGIIIMMIWGGRTELLSGVLWESLNIYGLTAVPAFMFMGELILRSGLSEKAFASIAPLAARLPGKLLQINIILCAIFAAVFGSSTACAAAVGTATIPELRKRGYKDTLIMGSIYVAGTLAFMIPPSSQFVIYGSIVGVSIASMFAAGTIPGVMLALFFIIYLSFQARITPQIAPDTEKPKPWVPSIVSLLKLWPLALIMFLCVGPIYLGLATATESAGIGVFAAILVGFFAGKLSWKAVWVSLRETTRMTSMLFIIIIGATIMATAVSQLGLPRQVIEWIGNISVNRWIIMGAIIVLYLILGCFFDGISMMLMTLPFVFPIVQNLGFDAVWFGVFLCLEIEIAMVTPPVGMNLYVIQTVAGQSGPTPSVWHVVRGAFPFLICSVVLLVFITVFPQIAIWLPGVIGR